MTERQHVALGNTAISPTDLYQLRGETRHRILNEVNGIHRVLCDVSTKPPTSIEWK
jgi:GMP synthase PP-ATPase subunit